MGRPRPVRKGFESTLETGGKLLRKALKAFTGSPREVDRLTYKDVLRHAAKHGLVDTDTVERWFLYRDNRNSTAHDYGVGFAEDTLKLLPGFIADARALEATLRERLGNGNGDALACARNGLRSFDNCLPFTCRMPKFGRTAVGLSGRPTMVATWTWLFAMRKISPNPNLIFSF